MAQFPSAVHARAAQSATEFLASCDEVDAVMVVGSCARRSDANDLDISALVASSASVSTVEARLAEFVAGRPEFEALTALGPFVEIDFHALSGEFEPGPRSWTTGPDAFELDLGNEVAYSRLLWERNGRLSRLRSDWLPFYDEELRRVRLDDARMYVVNDLEHVPLMIKRDEPFNAFHRLYLAFQGFLQALFISRRTYPIAYDKWIREQVEELLGLPDLYRKLPSLIGVGELDLASLARSTDRLRHLLDEWTVAE
jgi:predicted nucleotidyltransferase